LYYRYWSYLFCTRTWTSLRSWLRRNFIQLFYSWVCSSRNLLFHSIRYCRNRLLSLVRKWSLFMGNMSNPAVNRWGINTFWYKFWYSDTNYSSNLTQDTIITKLIHIYLFYGLNNSRNIFLNAYWFYTSVKALDLNRYYRVVPEKKTAFGVNPEYRLRYSVQDVYPMKIWILRYGGWFIFNFYWFQPPKVKKFRSTGRKRTRFDQYRFIDTPSPTSVRRLKTLLSYTFIKTLRLKKLYHF